MYYAAACALVVCVMKGTSQQQIRKQDKIDGGKKDSREVCVGGQVSVLVSVA